MNILSTLKTDWLPKLKSAWAELSKPESVWLGEYIEKGKKAEADSEFGKAARYFEIAERFTNRDDERRALHLKAHYCNLAVEKVAERQAQNRIRRLGLREYGM
jgi:hypothetical protein